MPAVPVRLHPESLKHLAKGHPYIIKDKFTESFRAKDRFLLAKDIRKNYILLCDTAHPKIKARLWKTLDKNDKGDYEEGDFVKDLEIRLQNSIERRSRYLSKSSPRDVCFLTFGEADELPGLNILKLGNGILIQSYALFWKKYQKIITPLLRQIKSDGPVSFPQWIGWQERDDSKDEPIKPIFGKMPESFEVHEFGVKYLLNMTQGYDIGLYPDMAALREKLNVNWQDKKVLNLYCYTGAWSLYPLKQGASEVYSLDLSPKYLAWLEENLALNPDLRGEHIGLQSDTTKGLQKLISEGKHFDFIMCDPPSFSSDGKKTQSSLKSYETLIPLIEELLNPGGHAALFINTHGITRKKFTTVMEENLKGSKLRITKKLKLSDDCPILPGFPEGDYLKGVLIQKA